MTASTAVGKSARRCQSGEEVDVFTRPVDDAVRRDGMPASQSETERTTRAQTDLGEQPV